MVNELEKAAKVYALFLSWYVLLLMLISASRYLRNAANHLVAVLLTLVLAASCVRVPPAISSPSRFSTARLPSVADS